MFSLCRSQLFWALSLNLLTFLRADGFSVDDFLGKPQASLSLKLRLEHALWLPDRSDPDAMLLRDITLESEVVEGRLPADALGYACFWEGPLYQREGYNKADHEWRIRSVKWIKDTLVLNARLRVSRDMWGTGGGWGEYQIRLQRNQDEIQGNFEAELNGKKLQGNLTGTLSELWPRPVEGFQALQAREHPRLLFRAEDIPALREKAKTEEGQLIVKRLREVLASSDEEIGKETCGYEAAGQAFLYTLTGERAYADRAQEIVARIVGEGYTKGSGRGGNLWRELGVKRILTAAPAVGVALAYDLCYEVWPESFRDQITEELEQKARRLVIGVGRQEYNDNPSSNHYAICNGAGGLAALAIFDEPGSYPAAPLDPTQLLKIPVDPEFRVEKGMPVSRLVPGELPSSWLWAGPWKPESIEIDFLQEAGGRSTLLPRSGTELAWKGERFRFAEMPAKGLVNNRYTGNQDALHLVGLIDRNYHSTVYLFTVVHNEEDALLRYRCEHGGTRAFLQGVELRDGMGIELAAGSYPLMLQVGIGATNDWGMILSRPRFENLIEEELEQAKRIYVLEKAAWEEGLAAYEARGGTRPLAHKILKLATAHLQRHLEMSYGEKGWYNEGNGYKRYALRQGAFPFLQAYEQVMGREFIYEDRGEWILLEWMSKAIIRQDSLSLPLYGPGERQWTTGFTSGDFSLGMGLLPERDHGVARWLFNRRYGLQGDQSFDISRPHHAIFALVHLPLDAEEEHPSTRLPRAHRDHYHGGMLFRKGWKDDQDILASITSKERPLPGWNFFDAASFRILGFGSQWAWRGEEGVSKKRGHREHENVLQVQGVRGAFGAETLSWSTEEDGSGQVRMRIVHPYLGEAEGKGQPPRDLGIRGERSFAVNYHPSSGTAAVFAILDRLSGSDAAEWIMHSGVEDFEAHPKGFTLRNEAGNTLRAHFLSEAPLEITKLGDRIRVSGAAEYLVLMTLNPGEAPPLLLEGNLEKAQGLIGDMKFLLDQKGIRFLPAPDSVP